MQSQTARCVEVPFPFIKFPLSHNKQHRSKRSSTTARKSAASSLLRRCLMAQTHRTRSALSTSMRTMRVCIVRKCSTPPTRAGLRSTTPQRRGSAFKQQQQSSLSTRSHAHTRSLHSSDPRQCWTLSYALGASCLAMLVLGVTMVLLSAWGKPWTDPEGPRTCQRKAKSVAASSAEEGEVGGGGGGGVQPNKRSFFARLFSSPSKPRATDDGL